MTNFKRTRVLIQLFVGSIVVLASVLADQILAQRRVWGLMQSLGLATGLSIIAIGFIHHRLGVISRASANLCLSLLSLFALLIVGEWGFRLIGFDFAGEARAWRRTPPFYRQPIAPTGTVFFKRPGPEQWTGQVLNTVLKRRRVLPNPYTNEPVITVEYDHRGFRNPDYISDWQIAVAGDSFTELGHLPYQQLFTSILGRILNVSVLNLGTSHTGPLTQLSYLADYGIGASTRHTMIVFFEGNDLENLANEYRALVRWKETGQRDYREFRKQPSLLKALRRFLLRADYRIASNHFSARFKSSHGDIPITVEKYTPPGGAQLSKQSRHHLNYFFRQYADFGRDQQVTVWLAYMPIKRRVLHGHLEFSAGAPDELENWQPSDLPEILSEMCNQYGVRFVDLTPELIGYTRRHNELLYSSVYDIHLNSQGSQVAGQELARHFSGQMRNSENRRGYSSIGLAGTKTPD